MKTTNKISTNFFLITIFLTNSVFGSVSEVKWDGYEEMYLSLFTKTCASIEGNSDDLPNLKGWALSKKIRNEAVYRNETYNKEFRIRTITRNGKLQGLRYTFFDGSLPKLYLMVGKQCKIDLVRLIERDQRKKINSISTLSNNLKVKLLEELINPEVPNFEAPEGVKVALIDTGVNYLIPKISSRLSRKKDGQLLGYDFQDDDNRPFDLDFLASPFFPRHHGTSVASLFIDEAPLAQLVPYRFSRTDPCKFKDIIEHINANDIKIVAIPMGSLKRGIWDCFYESANEYKHMLFIVSAGNNGINIDKQKVFPASFPLENSVVVSSSTIFGKLPQGANYGRLSVDFLVPAEQVEVIDHRGVRTQASGSSYAVPRIAAMVARFVHNNPKASINEIKQLLIERAITVDQNIVKYGWIPDPLDNYLF